MSPSEAEGVPARARAARVLAEVLAGRATLPEALARHPGAATDEGFVRELCWGTARHGLRLDFEVRRHLRQAPRSRDLDIQALLLLGGYQLAWMDVPDHAAVHATVAATGLLGKDWARGLVNAVLRKLAASDLRSDNPQLPDPARFDHPDWLLDALRQAWPDHWREIVAAGNARPPMTLRSRSKRALALAALAEAGIQAHPGTVAPQAIYLAQPQPVGQLPGFSNGSVSVQDEGAQLAAELLGAAPGERILDACAAPGGKALHLLELAPEIDLLALDLEPQRCQRVRENLARAGRDAQVVAGDGRTPRDWWDGRPFNRILLDAPCSATGILRRQPDIRLLRKASDVEDLVALQHALLAALWPLLAIGGRLLYCTCSVLPAENEQVIDAFIKDRNDVRVLPVDADWGHARSAGRQLLPSVDAHDGFYFATLERISEP